MYVKISNIYSSYRITSVKHVDIYSLSWSYSINLSSPDQMSYQIFVIIWCSSSFTFSHATYSRPRTVRSIGTNVILPLWYLRRDKDILTYTNVVGISQVR